MTATVTLGPAPATAAGKLRGSVPATLKLRMPLTASGGRVVITAVDLATVSTLSFTSLAHHYTAIFSIRNLSPGKSMTAVRRGCQVECDGKAWTKFDAVAEVVTLPSLSGTAARLVVTYKAAV